MRTERESGRLAVLHLERFFDLGGMRIDPLDRPRVAFAAGAVDFRYGDVEHAGAGIPHRLFRAVGGIRERDPIDPFDVLGLCEHSSLRIHLDQGRERLVVGVVHRKEEVIHGVVGQLIGTEAVGSASGDLVDNRVRLQIDGYHPAGRVGHDEKLMSGAPDDHDAVGARGVVVAGEPFEPPRDLLDERVRFCVDDIDDGVRTVGEIVELGRLVDPADIEDEHLPGRIGGASRNRNAPEKLDRSSI